MAVVPVNNKYHLEYAKEVFEELKNINVRVTLDDRDEKLGYKMRELQTKKIPYILVLGQNEVDSNSISYRIHGSSDTTNVTRNEFMSLIKGEINEKNRTH